MPELDAALASEVSAAAAALRRGDIVAYPTETSYGLAVAAFDEAALARLFALKGRGAEKAFSVLVVGEAMVARLTGEIAPAARRLIEAHWPGPLTLALPARAGLPEALVLDGCVAMRESPNPVARALVLAAGGPITATSANRAGAAPARTADEVRAAFPSGCFVLDGGPTPGGPPSTLARVRGDRVEVLRRGVLALDETVTKPPGG
jgi:L-threonylcarbamoyladenylate synthase